MRVQVLGACKGQERVQGRERALQAATWQREAFGKTRQVKFLRGRRRRQQREGVPKAGLMPGGLCLPQL